MKFLSTLVVGLLLAGLPVCAQNSQPSAKVTAKTANLTLVPKTSGGGAWQTVMSNTIKTASQKDIFASVSLEVGLFTSTTASSKNMTPDTSAGQAEVDVRVLIDGNAVEPGVVVFGRRTQTLSATLEGAIGSCLVTSTNLDGSFSTTVNLGCVTPESVGLILDSLQAASFNFVAVDVPQGTHTISVQAKIDTIGSAQTGSYSALAFVGKGSLTVESVRLVKDPAVVLDVP